MTGVQTCALPISTVADARALLAFDPRTWFADPARRFELEIGSGKGTFLLQQATLEPDTNFLGIEWAGEFWAYAADRIRRAEMRNVRLLHGDATEFIRTRVPDAIALARRAMRVIRQNLAWAFAYNLVLLPLAAGALWPWTGWMLPPIAASAAMALSSVSVVANSLRLRRG